MSVHIGVCGAGACTPEEAEAAREVGRLAAEAGAIVVTGGLGGVIAVGGEYGTLSEIALALKLGVPVVGIGTWRLERDGLGGDPIARAADAAEAVRLALRLAAR